MLIITGPELCAHFLDAAQLASSTSISIYNTNSRHDNKENRRAAQVWALILSQLRLKKSGLLERSKGHCIRASSSQSEY